jgi:hypothetical protein
MKLPKGITWLNNIKLEMAVSSTAALALGLATGGTSAALWTAAGATVTIKTMYETYLSKYRTEQVQTKVEKTALENKLLEIKNEKIKLLKFLSLEKEKRTQITKIMMIGLSTLATTASFYCFCNNCNSFIGCNLLKYTSIILLTGTVIETMKHLKKSWK